jgi:hypothetical protein
MPVGLWVMRTAESVVFTDWPLVRMTDTVDLQILGPDLDVPPASPGNTATVAVDVQPTWDS